LIYKAGARGSRGTSKEGERTLNSSPLREPPFSPLRGVEKKKKKFLNKKVGE
jgi:hypothetical protein